VILVLVNLVVMALAIGMALVRYRRIVAVVEQDAWRWRLLLSTAEHGIIVRVLGEPLPASHRRLVSKSNSLAGRGGLGGGLLTENYGAASDCDSDDDTISEDGDRQSCVFVVVAAVV